MNEYAKRALDKLASARNLIASYFRDDKADRPFPTILQNVMISISRRLSRTPTRC
jgi:hypothetical protein